jgi:adenosylcobinamide-phosphate synthase
MTFAWYLPTVLIAAALLIDMLLGDPSWLPHPVRFIGQLIEFAESALWTGHRGQDLRRGGLLVVHVIAAVVVVTCALVVIAFWGTNLLGNEWHRRG